MDPLVDLRAGWRDTITFGLGNPALFWLLIEPDRASTSGAVNAGLRVLQVRVRRVAEAGLLRVSEQRAVGVIQAAGVGAVTILLRTPAGLRDAGLADAMLEAVLCQILTDPPDRVAGAAVSTAVAFRALLPQLHALSGAEQQLLIAWLDRALDGR